MHPPLREIADLLARIRDDVLVVWQAIPPDTRERRLSPGRCGLGAETDHRSRLDTFDLPALVTLPPFDAPEFMVPVADVRAADAEAGLRTSRAALDRLISSASGLALGEVRARHMRFGEIDFYQWLLFIAGHEQRHARQLAALRDDLAREEGGREGSPGATG